MAPEDVVRTNYERMKKEGKVLGREVAIHAIAQKRSGNIKGRIFRSLKLY